MTDGQYLFSDGALDEALEGAKREMQQEILSAAEDYLLNVDIDEWVAHLVEKHRIEPLAVRRDEMFFEDLGEAQVDVRYGQVQRAIFDYSEPVYIAGRASELHIPFAGDPGLLRLRPRTFTYNPPQASVKGEEIVKHFSWPSDTARPDLKAQADQLANSIEQYANWSRDLVESYNGELEGLARQTIQNRRERVLADHAHLDDIRIPVRRRRMLRRRTRRQGSLANRRQRRSRRASRRERRSRRCWQSSTSTRWVDPVVGQSN